MNVKSNYSKGVLRRGGKRKAKAKLNQKKKEFALPRNHILVKIWNGLLYEAYEATNTSGLTAEQFPQFLRAYWKLWNYQEQHMTMFDKMQLQEQLKEHYQRRHVQMRGLNLGGHNPHTNRYSTPTTRAQHVDTWDRLQLATNNILHDCSNVEIMKNNLGYGICEIHDYEGGPEGFGVSKKIKVRNNTMSKRVRLLGTSCSEICRKDEEYSVEPDKKAPKILYCARHQYHACKYQPKGDNLIHKQIKKDKTKSATKKNMRMCDCANEIYKVARWFDCEHFQCKQSVDMYNFCLTCGSGMRVS